MSAALREVTPRRVRRPPGVVVELRAYTIHAARREAWMARFARESVEASAGAGVEACALFRDLDAPDDWIRMSGVPGIGPCTATAPACTDGTSTMVVPDASHPTRPGADASPDAPAVLRLHACRPVGGFTTSRARLASAVDAGDVLLAHLLAVRAEASDGFPAWFERRVLPLLWEANIGICASYTTDARRRAMSMPPSRESGSVFVWFSRHASEAKAHAARARIDEGLDWRAALSEELALRLSAPMRSLLRVEAAALDACGAGASDDARACGS